MSGFSKPGDGGDIIVYYTDKGGKKPNLAAHNFRRNQDWSEASKSFPIPPEAAQLTMIVRLSAKTTGTVEISDLRIVEKGTADPDAPGVEIYSMPPIEWHPATTDAHMWMTNCDGAQLQLLSDSGGKYLRLTKESESGAPANFNRRFRIDPATIKSITLSARLRAPTGSNADSSDEKSFPHASMVAMDHNGKLLSNTGRALTPKIGADWSTMKTTLNALPPDTASISFGFSFGATGGGAIEVSEMTCELELKAPRPAEGNAGEVKLELLRDGKLLAETFLPAKSLAGGSVRIAAERVGNVLRLQLGQQPPLEVFDPFPLGAQKFHPVLLTAPDLSLRSLSAYRQSLPEKPQPLELGDAQFSAGNEAGALAAYEAQLPIASDPATRAEARLKIGLCLVQQKRVAEAEASFLEAVKADAPPWSGLASFQLLTLFLQQKRVTEADAVMAALRARRDFAATAGTMSDDLRSAIKKGYATLGRAMLESGNQQERQATIERLERLLEVADVLRIDVANQFSLRFGICRLYAVTGQTAQALAYCVEQLTRMEQQEFPFELFAGLFAEVYYNIMAQGGRHGEALPLLQKWDALGPNDFTAIQAARCLLALKRFDEAGEKITGVLARVPPLNAKKQTTPLWVYASLLRGLMAETRDGADAGRAAWAASFRELREAIPTHDPALCIGGGSRQVLIGFILLGGLSGELRDEDMPSLRKGITSTYAELESGAGSAKQMMFKNAAEQFSKPVCLSLCTGERGGAYARSFIRGEMLFFEAYRMPFIFMLEEYFIQDSGGRESLTAGQEALFWQASVSINDAIREQQVTTAQMLGLLAAWKGITNAFGWDGAQAQMPPKMRGPIAYIMGRRYVKLGKPEDALGMFRTAKADAAETKDAPLAALAETEIRNLGGK